ncbi:RusA family crossover junction endodeoxyribonuclease [Parvularcula dongshanensis]|uniref:Holliday junction resolvase RusA-like endonuclease n=1 Tax=Parvularcula dongshanensis TaxID=1173995 RepID=A0A840HZX8_9PROT|nr:RusA family crossover junction endodeoxyribonuclease [Parvularcula dongshanensis]MBB4657655.1 Holliday junction resolvase RusA-like endonuclease [Parvularcula dongshanensis]
MGSGAGKLKVFTERGASLVVFDAATTQTRALKKIMAAAVRSGTKVRPARGPVEVRIWTSVLAEKAGAHDVDNIAKAVLDALWGVFYLDDRQVVRLISERFEGHANRIAVRVTPLDAPVAPVELTEALLLA